MKLIIDIQSDFYKNIGRIKNGSIASQNILNAVKVATPLDSIIADIEATRDKDKLCEYPYVRCVEIIKKAMGHEEKTMDEGNK